LGHYLDKQARVNENGTFAKDLRFILAYARCFTLIVTAVAGSPHGRKPLTEVIGYGREIKAAK
jgi:hypothetical protein